MSRVATAGEKMGGCSKDEGGWVERTSDARIEMAEGGNDFRSPSVIDYFRVRQ